jgi:oxygen-independent coproporphyrinogen-3 oxidase
MKALLRQLEYELQRLDRKIETVFIGGGTPSTVEASYYKKILYIIKPYLLNKDIEITIEANPNSAQKSWLEQIRETGINRISFGVQSFNNEKLEFLGRNHNKDQAIEAIKQARDAGFKNINCDIIYDTALDTKELLQNDLKIIKELPVNHVSAYSLTIEEGTKFFNKSSVRLENIEHGRFLFNELEKLGFKQYEISNFAKTNDARSRHNLGYWEYKEYLGTGSGAVGCINSQRVYNEKDVIKYIEDPLKYEEIETLSKDDILIEKILLGFRSVVGVDKNILNEKQYEKLQDLIEAEKVIKKNGRIYSSDFLLADELALYIDCI